MTGFQDLGAIFTIRVTGVIALLALATSASGCANYNNQVYRAGSNANYVGDGYNLRFVEADDEGWFWRPEQARLALDEVRQSVASKDTFVLLFVHGWHHSAACCDDNIEGFKETLSRLHVQLRNLRGSPGAAGHDDFTLIGIYLGWRAESLPSYLDYFTFWSRKSAAERTGESDAREFLDRLNQLYREHNMGTQGNVVGMPQTFLGLVTIGHSFGSQVVLRAVAAAMEQELELQNPAPGYMRSSSNPGPSMPSARALHGFGDVVVLVNPAVEAAAYQRLRALSQGLTYSPDQSPVMLTVSADNDWERHWPFRWGRILGEWFEHKPYKDDPTEREIERQALGVYGPAGIQVTHRLEPVDEGAVLVRSHISHPAESFCGMGSCACEWYEWRKPRQAPAKPPVPDSLMWGDSSDTAPNASGFRLQLSTHDFSANNTFGQVTLKPDKGAIPYQPFIVASASKAVIDGHNGIFSGPFVDFLTRYVGFIEGKQYLLRSRIWAAGQPP